jgi:DNA-binding XRE family transcriptional regulator
MGTSSLLALLCLLRHNTFVKEDVPERAQVHDGREWHWTVRSGADLGRAIAEIRRTRGLTQSALASQSGLSRHWLAKLETGRSAVVLDHMLRVLRRLGATVTITFTESGSTSGTSTRSEADSRG